MLKRKKASIKKPVGRPEKRFKIQSSFEKAMGVIVSKNTNNTHISKTETNKK